MRRLLLPTVGLAAAATLAAAPAGAAPDHGLFGSQDPTYDGVYRQGLAISGLVAADARVPKSAVTWLLTQQCGNGSFTSYRVDPDTACGKPDPDAYTGPDTNATAVAAMALRAAGERGAARDAFAYLLRQPNKDGGLPWFRGGTSDSNSTGLFLSAAHDFPASARTRSAVRGAKKWLRSVQLRCSDPVAGRGLLRFQAGQDSADPLGSAQGALGLLSPLPVAGDPSTGSAVRCDGDKEIGSTSVTAGLLHALARDLADGLLPSSMGSGRDLTASANAAMALAAAEHRRDVVDRTVRALRKRAKTYTVSDGSTSAGAVATLLLTADATGANPARFGGVDLVAALLASRR